MTDGTLRSKTTHIDTKIHSSTDAIVCVIESELRVARTSILPLECTCSPVTLQASFSVCVIVLLCILNCRIEFGLSCRLVEFVLESTTFLLYITCHLHFCMQ